MDMNAYSFKETLIQQVYKANLENARSLFKDTTECTIICNCICTVFQIRFSFIAQCLQ